MIIIEIIIILFIIFKFLILPVFRSDLRKCDALKGNLQDYCYQTVALATLDVHGDAISICNRIKSTGEKGECYHNIAKAYLNNANPFSSEKSIYICSITSDQGWKDECYFSIAGLIYDSGNIELAYSLCNKSGIFAFNCNGHLEMLAGRKSNIPLCTNLSLEYLPSCYRGMGRLISRQNYLNVSKAILACNQIHSDYIKYCTTGLLTDIRDDQISTPDLLLDKCTQFSASNKPACYDAVGWVIGLRNEKNASKGKEICDKIPTEYKRACYIGLESAISKTFSYNFTLVSNFCDDISEEYRRDCYVSLSHIIAKQYTHNVSKAVAKCMDLPLLYQKNCFQIISELIVNQYMFNVSVAVHACSEPYEDFQQICYEWIIQAINKYPNPDSIQRACNSFTGQYREQCIGIENKS